MDPQKIVFIIGPTRSGKGVTVRVLGQLIGSGNVAAPTLKSLSSNFGLAGQIGKPLAVIGDMRPGGKDRTGATPQRGAGQTPGC
jgi:putative DNA primase/helicase